MLNEQAKSFAAKHPEEAHNFISRTTTTAMGKTVRKGITTVSLLLTFVTEHDKDRFQNIAKDCGTGTKLSFPKQDAETAGKVAVTAPSMWGRGNGNQKDSFLKASFERFL